MLRTDQKVIKDKVKSIARDIITANTLRQHVKVHVKHGLRVR